MLSRKRTNSFTSTSNESSPRSTHRDYYDGEYNKMWEDVKKMKLGSTVAYAPNNQMGYKRYRVVKNKNGKKDLKLIENYEGSIHQSRSESSIESVNSHESESSMQSRGSKRRKVGGKKQKSRRKRNN